jgi:PIN domain nuclease of toxin-antitoxin system
LESAAVILLDTHALVWLVTEPRRLSAAATRAIERAYSKGGVGIAGITLWEIAALFVAGRLKSRGTVEASVRRIASESRVVVHDIDPEIAALAVQLPDSVPKDAADRLIVATAVAKAFPLVTKDARIHEAGACDVIW